MSIEKKELLRGTIEELEDYFYNEIGVNKYDQKLKDIKMMNLKLKKEKGI